MQRLTVKDYAKRKNVSEKTVYSWVKKDQVNYTVETVQGRSVTYILVPYVQNEVNKVNEPIANSNEQKESSQLHENNRLIDTEKMFEFMNRMYEDNRELAEAAGQVRLLTDSENRTKQEYFQVIQENATLKAKIETLQEKLKQVEEKQYNITDWLRRL